MAKISLILSALFLSGLVTACGSKDSQTQNTLRSESADRISGGAEAPKNSTDPGYWAVAQLKRKTIWTKTEKLTGGTMAKTSTAVLDCTATLVEKDILITAAHCVEPETRTGPEGYSFSRSDLFAEFTQAVGFPIRVSAVIEYPGFKMNKADLTTYLKNDIAILKLESPALEPLKPVAIFKENLSEGQQLNIRRYGYGLTNMVNKNAFADGETIPEQSKHEDILRVLDDPGTILKASKIISFDARKLDAGICPGDSGGPNFTYINGQIYLVGVTSSYSEVETDKDLCRGENRSALLSEYQSWLQESLTKIKRPHP